MEFGPGSRGRAVLVAATVGLVVGTLGLWGWSSERGSPSPGCPCGAVLSVSSVNESHRGADRWYNVTVQTGAPGVAWSDIEVRLLGANGTALPVGGDLSAVVDGVSGPPIAVYTFAGGTGSTASDAGIASGEAFDLGTVGVPSLGGQGVELAWIGVGSFSGSTLIGVP